MLPAVGLMDASAPRPLAPPHLTQWHDGDELVIRKVIVYSLIEGKRPTNRFCGDKYAKPKVLRCSSVADDHCILYSTVPSSCVGRNNKRCNRNTPTTEENTQSGSLLGRGAKPPRAHARSKEARPAPCRPSKHKRRLPDTGDAGLRYRGMCTCRFKRRPSWWGSAP